MHSRGDAFELRTPTTDLDPNPTPPADLLASVRAEVQRETLFAPVDTLDPAPPRFAEALPDLDVALPELDVPGSRSALLEGLTMLLLASGVLFAVLFATVAGAGALLAP